MRGRTGKWWEKCRSGERAREGRGVPGVAGPGDMKMRDNG